MSQNLTYTMQGDYLIPDLIPPEAPKLGKYGMLRHSYLREKRAALFTGMLLSGKLNSHLEEIDQQAKAMMDRLTRQMATNQGVNETLKATNQMLWVQKMTNIQHDAEEIVMNQLICS